jgi:hypothetical protein
MTIFGPAWADLTLQDVQSYLDDAEDEPLLWEAKGITAHGKEVRRQVCAFANSHEGGYVIVGANKAADQPWALNGVPFADEPRTWISNVIADPEGGVRPRPDFDVHAWEAPDGHVAVIRVTPTSTPPCLANGTVYERLPGKTQTVLEPLRLADLFSRGDKARRAAQEFADRAAALALDAVTEEEDAQEGEEAGARPPLRAIRFAVGVAATGNPPDIASRLFKNAFATKYWERFRDLPSVVPEGFGRPPDPVEFSQTALLWRREMRGPQDYDIVLRASWDGAAAVAERIAAEDAYLDDLVDHRVGPDWLLADEVVQDLRGFGDFYVTVLFTGGTFRRRPGPDDEIVAMRRGPLLAGVDAGHLASLGRELLRSVGSPTAEP